VKLLVAAACIAIASGQTPPKISAEENAKRVAKRVLKPMRIKRGSKVADVGCGDGFFTLPLARAVGKHGIVYAVDISDTELAALRERLTKTKLKNVEVVRGLLDDPKLPEHALDRILVANAYHEMTMPREMLGHMRSALKPGGTIAVMEQIASDHIDKTRAEQAAFHELAPQIAKDELIQAGFEIVAVRDHLIEQPDGKSWFFLVLARRPGEK